MTRGEGAAARREGSGEHRDRLGARGLRSSVTSWRDRFEEEALKKFGKVKSGRGRKPTIPDDKVAAIVEATLHEKPPGETHWSCRSMAKAQGGSPATVQRVWAARGLKPHLVKTFKLSNDKRFEEKLVDVVGLYLDPPDKAVVLCMDEESQIQALDRTQPSLPMKKGPRRHYDPRLQAQRHDDAVRRVERAHRRGHRECLPRHRHEEFLKFLRKIDREVPKGLAVHMILDNYATHKHPDVVKWLDKHQRFHLHFTPT